ncbi:MAG: GNAT family N-acetyltransferase [Clostridia bacterium]|nr:GNAT family N-acetyltransferase [Clostridia bacterium]
MNKIELKPYVEYNETEILALYSSVGWTAYTDAPEKLRLGFENSLYILGAYENEKLVGLIRAVGDGHTVVFIQDILIHPEHQRRGIGGMLLKAVLERYDEVRQIELATDDTEKTVAFYKSLGFAPMTELGCCGFMKLNI